MAGGLYPFRRVAGGRAGRTVSASACGRGEQGGLFLLRRVVGESREDYFCFGVWQGWAGGTIFVSACDRGIVGRTF